MATATLQTVDPGHRKFQTKHGDFAAFDVYFTDGRHGQVVTKLDTLVKRQGEFQDLIGKEHEFEITDGGTFPDGNPKPLKVKLPSTFGQGSERGAPARAPRDEAFIQERMDRRTALMQAVIAEPEGWVVIGDWMYEWLRKTADGGNVRGEGAEPSSASTPTSVGTGSEGEKPLVEDAPLAGASPDWGGCIHPESNRHVTASGKVRCGLCGELVKV